MPATFSDTGGVKQPAFTEAPFQAPAASQHNAQGAMIIDKNDWLQQSDKAKVHMYSE